MNDTHKSLIRPIGCGVCFDEPSFVSLCNHEEEERDGCFAFIVLRAFVLFGLILYVPSTTFQFSRDGSSWVEPVLSYDLKDTTQ